MLVQSRVFGTSQPARERKPTCPLSGTRTRPGTASVVCPLQLLYPSRLVWVSHCPGGSKPHLGPPGTTFLSTRLQEAGLLLDPGDADAQEDLH